MADTMDLASLLTICGTVLAAASGIIATILRVIDPIRKDVDELMAWRQNWAMPDDMDSATKLDRRFQALEADLAELIHHRRDHP